MARFQIHQWIDGIEDNRFEMTGSLIEGDIGPGMFLHVWVNMMLYYPYRIVAIEPANGPIPRNIRLTFESELGEEGLLHDMDLRNRVYQVAETEACLVS